MISTISISEQWNSLNVKLQRALVVKIDRLQILIRVRLIPAETGYFCSTANCEEHIIVLQERIPPKALCKQLYLEPL